jgi:hypothetical protein
MRATVWVAASRTMSAAPIASNHSELKRSSVRSRIEHLEHLVGVGGGVGRDVLAGERLAGGVLAGRVADHPGEVADQEDDRVPEVLELPHLVEQHGVADVQVRRGRVEAGLDPQRAPDAQARLEFVGLEDFIGAATDQNSPARTRP